MSSCPDCGAEAPSTAAHCPDCGAALDGTPTSASSDVVAGFVAGLLALVVGFAITAVAANTEENRQLVEDLLSSTGPGGVSLSQFLPEWYQVIGWVFLDSHQVEVSASVGDEFGNADWIGEYVGRLIPAAGELQLVPPVLLVTAGFLLASRGNRQSLVDAGRAGATVFVGYLPGIVLLLLVTSFEVVLPVIDVLVLEIAPHYGQALLVAGVGYPVVFGGLGGLVGYGVDRLQ